MTAQQAATNTIANVLCGDIGRCAEISKYNSRAVAPNRPRYNMPSCDWAERMTPEFPESIAYNAINTRKPDTNTDVAAALSESIGFRNVSPTSASPITKADRANTARHHANSRPRRPLPC